MKTSPGIAVTGASGAVGSRVVRLLAAREAPLVLLTRDASRVPAVSGAQVRLVSGYGDQAGMTAALHGCTTLFLVSGRESANRIEEHSSAVAAAVAAGVERVVYLSFQGAGPTCTFTFARDHWHTEQLIRDTAMRFTFLRDSFYQSALAAMCGPDGVIRGPAGDGAVAAVAHADVAAVAAAALLSSDWVGQTLDVTGPEAITMRRLAELLARHSGRPVRYVEETEEEAYASRAHFGAPEFEVRGWVSTYQAIARGEVAPVSDTVNRVTGHRAITLDSLLQAHPEHYRHLVRTN